MVDDVPALLDVMDQSGIETMVNLDGRWGEELDANLQRYDRAYPGRFLTFCHVDWSQARREGFGERLAAQLRESAAAGAGGLKVWKDVGLSVTDPRGDFLLPDDPRVVPLWETAGELGLPVMIHTGDPLAFFQPVDRHNERLEEILAHPEWDYSDPRFPRFERLLQAFESVVRSHPRTVFIGAHVGGFSEDLSWVDRMLRSYPNLYVDIAARISELGRQPRACRRLLLNHPSRVLFGSDGSPSLANYAVYFRFLETDDEHFAYSADERPNQGRWAVSGIDLPEEVLRLVYRENARALLKNAAERSEAAA